jgi:hypothetical protein
VEKPPAVLLFEDWSNSETNRFFGNSGLGRLESGRSEIGRSKIGHSKTGRSDYIVENSRQKCDPERVEHVCLNRLKVELKYLWN